MQVRKVSSRLMAAMAGTIAFSVANPVRAEQPRLPPGSILASYSDYAAEISSPVYAAFKTPWDKMVAEAKRATLKANPKADVGMFDSASTEKILGFKDADCQWVLTTVGEVVVPTGTNTDFRCPDLTIAIQANLNPQATVAALSAYLAKGENAGKIVPDTLDGRPIWKLVHKDLALIGNLAPCLAFKGNRLMMIASNPKALRQLLDLYDGKVPPLPPTHPLHSVLQLKPPTVSRVMIPAIDQLLNKLLSAEDRKGLNENPQLALTVNTLRSLALETCFLPAGNEIQIVLQVGCASEKDAQAMSELLITLKTTGKMLTAGLVQEMPELSILSDWLERIRVTTAGASSTVTFSVKAEDLSHLNLEKLMADTPFAAGKDDGDDDDDGPAKPAAAPVQK